MTMNSEEVARFYKALKDTKLSAVEALVKEHVSARVPPVAILEKGLVGAMAIVGQEFRAGQIWVPEVLLAARNLSRGIEVLRPELVKGDLKPKGKIVIGTVKGDIHDIGKNLVAIMMTGAGYEVIDLGTDVSQEKFLEAITREHPDLVGLSALLTTTMLEMKGIIQRIRDTFSAPPKILIGGAPVNQKFSEEIRADGYGEDAVRAVEVADRVLSSRGQT